MRDFNHDNKIDSRDHALFDLANSSRTNRGSGGGCGTFFIVIIIALLILKGCSS